MLQIYCRGQPPDYVLRDAKNSSKFFKCVGSLQNVESSESSKSGRSLYQALTVEEYESVSLVCYRFQLLGLLSKMNNLASHQFFFFFSFWFLFLNITWLSTIIFLFPVQRELKKPSIGKEYFNHMNLEAIVTNYPYRKNLPNEDIVKG